MVIKYHNKYDDDNLLMLRMSYGMCKKKCHKKAFHSIFGHMPYEANWHEP